MRQSDLARFGMVMAVPGFVTVLTLTPACALVDWIGRKRTW